MSGARGGTYHHGDLRVAATRAASSIVAADGSSAVTTRAVAAAVGVSHAALYRHFRNRAELVDAVAATWLAGFVDRSAEDDLVGFVQRYASEAVASEHLYRCVFEAAADPGAAATRAALVDLRRRAAAVYALGGDRSADEVRDGVIEMWGTLHGMLDLYWRGLLAARSPEGAARWIARRVLARHAG